MQRGFCMGAKLLSSSTALAAGILYLPLVFPIRARAVFYAHQVSRDCLPRMLLSCEPTLGRRDLTFSVRGWAWNF